jgi:hypothetical protein
VDGFIEYCRGELARFSATTHFIGNLLVEIDPGNPDLALSEAYALAFHRIPATGDEPERDYVVGLRYLDRFERRAGRWAIAARRCALDWQRIDDVGRMPAFRPGSLLGVAGPDDPVFAPDRDRGTHHG